ncbi:MAG TPA: hypothetical protein VME68_12870 [Acidobacteriaceae bacterium]|nr:hypothetical protein [Acidobacteriaceae bacterium]
MDTMEKQPIPIDDWAVVESASVPAWRALEPGHRLLGYVYTHSDLPGGLICTSPIVHVDEAQGLVETRNHVYRLGRRSEDYERWLRAQETPKAA